MIQATPPPSDWKELHLLHRLDGYRTRLFTVVSNKTIYGKRKGETLEIVITDSQADALIIAGHITEKFEPTPKVDIVKVAEATKPPRVASSTQNESQGE